MGKTPVTKQVIELPSNPQEVARIERFIEKLNKQLALDDTRYNKLLVAVTEAVNNGIIHGNRKDPSKKVTVTWDVTPAMLTIRVQDEGPGIDPDTLPDPLAEENLLRENGRGVFLMRSLMDEVMFERFDGGSAVIMKLKLS